MTPLFVAATGTDIGKTYVAVRLIGALRARGLRVAAFKPVVSGFDPADAEGSDPIRLLRALGQPVGAQALDATAPWRLRAPLSPDMAAAREGVTLELAAIAAWCRNAIAGAAADIAVVEGAGGVMSPIASDGLNIDLIAALHARVLLVAGTYLGTISHTLTAIEALRARRIEVAGLILSESENDAPVPPEEIARALEAHVRGIPIVIIPRRDDGAASAALADLARQR